MNTSSSEVSGSNMTSTLSTVEASREDYQEYQTAEAIWLYAPPFLLLLGTVGNILSILVLSRPGIRQSTTSLYLRVLAVMDIIVLNTGLLRQWLLRLIDTDIREQTEIGCKIHIWVVYVSVHCSAWLLVAVTLERVLSVTFPHLMKMRCTRKAAYSIIAAIIAFFLLLNAHYLYGVGDYVFQSGNQTKMYPCEGITDEYFEFETKIWPWVDFCLYSFVPSAIFIVSNFIIIRAVYRSEQNDTKNYSGDDTRKSQTSTMTMTLVTVSVTYVLCTTPFCVYTIYDNMNARGLSAHTKAVRSLCWAVVNVFQYANNAVNFILYCVTGSRFRMELKALFCGKKLKSRPTMYTTTSTRINSTSTTNDSVKY